jgi:hypothetical protein
LVGGTQWPRGIPENDEDSRNNPEKLPLILTQLVETGADRLCHIGQRALELAGALDHCIRGIPARTRIADEFLLRNATCVTLGLELVPTLRRAAYLEHKMAELGDARQPLGLRGFTAAEAGIVVRGLCSQLAQQRLDGQVRDMSKASHVLFILFEHDAAMETGSLEANQKLGDVGGVIGGHAQKLGEYPKLIARRNKCPAQVFARVRADQRDKTEDERTQFPVVVDVVAGDPQEIFGVGRCPAVERGGDLAGYGAQQFTDASFLLPVSLHDLALDGFRRRNSDAGS